MLVKPFSYERLSLSNDTDNSDELRPHLIDELDAAITDYQAASDALDEAVAVRLGINRTDLQCLDIAYRRGPLTAGQLAEETSLTPGAITAALDRLERGGYARRVRDEIDRRRVVVETTARTRELVRGYYGPLDEESRARLLERLSATELTLIRDFLRAGRELQLEHAARIRTAGGPVAAADQGSPLASLSEAAPSFHHGGALIKLSSAPSPEDPLRGAVRGPVAEHHRRRRRSHYRLPPPVSAVRLEQAHRRGQAQHRPSVEHRSAWRRIASHG